MARILVIDDDDFFRTMLQQLLESAGYEALTSTNGVEGVKMFDTHGVDVVVKDIIMSERGGLETIMALKKRRPNIKNHSRLGWWKSGESQFLEYGKKSRGFKCSSRTV